jgi:hypothetical protein
MVRRESLRRDGVTSRTLDRLENDSCGTPQPNGSLEAPLMPAWPATSSTNAKRLRVSADVREKFTDTLCWMRLWTMFNETGTARLDPVAVPPRVGNTLV